jgi:hypothetical protein
MGRADRSVRLGPGAQAYATRGSRLTLGQIGLKSALCISALIHVSFNWTFAAKPGAAANLCCFHSAPHSKRLHPKDAAESSHGLYPRASSIELMHRLRRRLFCACAASANPARHLPGRSRSRRRAGPARGAEEARRRGRYRNDRRLDLPYDPPRHIPGNDGSLAMRAETN